MRTISIFIVGQFKKSATWPWRCVQYALPKHRFVIPTRHGVISQNTRLFIRRCIRVMCFYFLINYISHLFSLLLFRFQQVEGHKQSWWFVELCCSTLRAIIYGWAKIKFAMLRTDQLWAESREIKMSNNSEQYLQCYGIAPTWQLKTVLGKVYECPYAEISSCVILCKPAESSDIRCWSLAVSLFRWKGDIEHCEISELKTRIFYVFMNN